MDREHLDLLVAGPLVDVGAVVEQQASSLGLLEKGGERQRREAVRGELVRVGACRQELAEAGDVAERGRLEEVEVGAAEPLDVLGSALVERLQQR